MAKYADESSKFNKNIRLSYFGVIKIPRKEIMDLWNLAGLELCQVIELGVL